MENTDNGAEKREGPGGASGSTPLSDKVDRSSEKGGRPPVQIDLIQLEKMCHINATQRELAAFFNCSVDTIQNRAKDDPAFAAAMERGYCGGWSSLRRKQMEVALDGNPTMLIWLGKQLLGQRDNLDSQVSGSDGGPIQITNVPSREIIAARIARIRERRSGSGSA